MGWLERRLERVRALVGEAPGAGYRPELAALVREVAARDGVMACFACHDGLLVDAAGVADFDAFAALSQQLTLAAQQSSRALGVGQPEQLVIVGARRKLALLTVAPFAIGVVAPTSVQLASVLAEERPS
jgi:predicted regulator of Ras-like GTPase activity (Roadblock/LC7/MglB family)